MKIFASSLLATVCVKAPKDQEAELIARGNGADGVAGRIRPRDAVIVKAKNGDVFRLTWGESGCGYDATFYVVSRGKVYSADQHEIGYLYEGLGLEILYDRDEGRLVITLDEWKMA